MTKRSRLPLLLVLAILVAAFVLTAKPAYAWGGPTCYSGDHHYSVLVDVMGNGLPAGSGCDPYNHNTVYCKIGTQHFEWDCVGGIVQNFQSWTPVFCGCPTVRVCC